MIVSHALFFTPSFASLRLLHALSSTSTLNACESPHHFVVNSYLNEVSHMCSSSANLVLGLKPLVQPPRLPAHPLAAPPRQPILRMRLQPQRHLRIPLPPRKPRPPLVLVYSGRWLPPQAPLPSDQLLAMASRRCFLAAVPSLHL